MSEAFAWLVAVGETSREANQRARSRGYVAPADQLDCDEESQRNAAMCFAIGEMARADRESRERDLALNGPRLGPAVDTTWEHIKAGDVVYWNYFAHIVARVEAGQTRWLRRPRLVVHFEAGTSTRKNLVVEGNLLLDGPHLVQAADHVSVIPGSEAWTPHHRKRIAHHRKTFGLDA